MHCATLTNYLQKLLCPEKFVDACPNGLQVQGKSDIIRLACGVSASLDVIEQAASWQADALLVHHGLFWRGQDPCVTGARYKRIASLLKNEINLFAYHLPLDSHPQLGNNACLAARLDFEVSGRFGEQDLGWLGTSHYATLGDLATRVAKQLGREPVVVGERDLPLQSLLKGGELLAWCSGAAQGMIEAAQQAGARVFLSGEISEPTAHFAREMGIAYLACGHHASERFGVQKLGAHLASQYELQMQFFDSDNPA